MIAFFGGSVVFIKDPLRQSIILSLFGTLLAILFLALKAPEAALSEIVVGAVIVPLMILLALAKVKSYSIEHRKNDK